jgi:transposase
LLIVSQDERDELMCWSQSRTLPAGDVFRARVILALADGVSYREIESHLHTSSPTIARWRKRFELQRMEGLNPQHKGSRPRVVTPAVQASHRAPHASGTSRWEHALELP